MKILRWFWDGGSKFPRVNEITQNQEIQNIGHRQIFTKYVTIKKGKPICLSYYRIFSIISKVEFQKVLDWNSFIKWVFIQLLLHVLTKFLCECLIIYLAHFIAWLS